MQICATFEEKQWLSCAYSDSVQTSELRLAYFMLPLIGPHTFKSRANECHEAPAIHFHDPFTAWRVYATQLSLRMAIRTAQCGAYYVLVLCHVAVH
jgi:hypothetical protein